MKELSFLLSFANSVPIFAFTSSLLSLCKVLTLLLVLVLGILT